MSYVRRAIEKRYRIVEKTLENATIYGIQKEVDDKWDIVLICPSLKLCQAIKQMEDLINSEVIHYVDQNIEKWTPTSLGWFPTSD